MTESKPLRMEDTALQTRVAEALRANWSGLTWGLARKDAGAVLAALGLDDLNAAVERGARRLIWEQHQGCVQWDDDPTDTATSGNAQTRAYALANVRAVLEAALTATNAPDALDEMIEDYTAEDPTFPEKLREADRRMATTSTPNAAKESPTLGDSPSDQEDFDARR